MSQIQDVDRMIDELIVREGNGAITNDPADAGGLTRWGWTQKTAAAYGFTRSVATMTREEAVDLYRQRFWLQPKFDQLAMIDPGIAVYLFDTGVLSGQTRGVHFLQRALNVLNQEQRTFPDLRVDGALGPLTFAALRAYIAARGQRGREVLLFMIRAQRSVFFMEIAERQSSQEKYMFGWQAERAMLGLVV